MFDIKYFNGDKYRGELAGDNRHGVGQFTYADGCSVIGEFTDNFLEQEGQRHPYYENPDETLVVQSFSKYEIRKQNVQS